jgi:hypothetical protein
MAMKEETPYSGLFSIILWVSLLAFCLGLLAMYWLSSIGLFKGCP